MINHQSTGSPIPEITLRVIVLAILLTILLATSNAYLALKLGILTSASIPAAIISMGVLRFFKQPTILEHNCVQTAASAGEAIAGGIVYTIPALIVIGYWHHFDYWTNCLIALIGGVLGVLFSIPFRRILVNDKNLNFPEGRAIAEVLKTSDASKGVSDIGLGGLIGAAIELCQVGLKVVANSWQVWFITGRSIVGLGAGFSATMIGAGFLVGFDMAISILIGALISWVIAFPILSPQWVDLTKFTSASEAAAILWNEHMRYLGIGAMIFAGIWTFVKLLPPLLDNVRHSLRRIGRFGQSPYTRVDQDIPLFYLLIGIVLTTVLMGFLFYYLFPVHQMGADNASLILTVLAIAYVLVIGFLFSAMTAYFSAMVGVTASPGSSVVIAGMLMAAWGLLSWMNHHLPLPFNEEQLQAGEAITIIIGSVVTGIAAIANDNSQDLKVGFLVGATPWRQQLMLLLGVLVSSLVIPPVMQLMFYVYGIAGVVPDASMDVSQTLPAPTAVLLAAISKAVFTHTLPWSTLLIGAGIIVWILVLDKLLQLRRWIKLSILGVAIGMYLPMSSSVPIFFGGMMARWISSALAKQSKNSTNHTNRMQRAVLIACGLVAGSALMDVCLAIPFSIWHSPDALMVAGPGWKTPGLLLALIFTMGLAIWIKKRVTSDIP
ncbi:OPT family oligopeptide transporter [Legionella sp. W05-934-2]|uniref:OPT family oligopeptide transporter n=1 Tax=Legionella sp. W05-934-2 TaxID=1198649 RepID=UPI003461B492